MNQKTFKPFLLATYGTLKRGYGNNRIIEHCKFIGETKTAAEFTMYDVSWFPGVIHSGSKQIAIEVFQVEDAETARRLDMLEGYPELYVKEFIKTEFGDALIYLYNYPTERLIEIESGKWE